MNTFAGTGKRSAGHGAGRLTSVTSRSKSAVCVAQTTSVVVKRKGRRGPGDGNSLP